MLKMLLHLEVYKIADRGLKADIQNTFDINY